MSNCCTPADRHFKAGWHDTHKYHRSLTKTSNTDVVLIGDSIIAGLTRYRDIWKEYFGPLKALNFGVGGDHTQNVLWRAKT